MSEPSLYSVDKQTHRLYLQIRSTTEEEFEHDMYVYLNEVDDFSPVEASVAKMIKEIRENYPEIAEQIESLPAGCENDKQIFDALADFVITIDWNYHSSLTTEDEKAELIDYIENYIAHHIEFDTSEYELCFDGMYFRKTAEGHNLTQHADDFIVKRGRIMGVALSPLEDDSGATSSYTMNVVLWSSVTRRWGGNEYLMIPVYAVDSVDNLRNMVYKAEDEGAEHPADEIDYESTEWAGLNNSVDAATDEGADVENAEVAHSGERAIDSQERHLASLEERLRQLFDISQKVAAEAFEDDEDRVAVQQSHYEYLKTFLEAYSTNPTLIEVSGPGIIALGTQLDTDRGDDADTTTMKFTNGSVVAADMFTVKKGYIDGTTIGVTENEDQTQSLVTLLNFLDSDTEAPVIIGNDVVEGFPFVRVMTAKRFIAVADSEQVSFTIPELEVIRSVKRQINQIEGKYADVDGLATALKQLHEFMASAVPTGYIDFPDVSLINNIGKMVGGNNDLSDRVSTAVLDIMIGAPLNIVGRVYDENGNSKDEVELIGSVIDIVPEISFIPENEPMIKLDDINSGVHYIPLSSIKSMRI